MKKEKTIYGKCPLCREAAYHIVKKDVYMYEIMDYIEVFKCTHCKKKWGWKKSKQDRIKEDIIRIRG